MALPATGYRHTTLAEFREDLQAAIRGAIGEGLPLSPRDLLGNIVDLVAARLDEVSEATQDLYDSFDERNAVETYLDNLAGLTGVERIEARKSSVTLTLGGVAGTVIPAASTVRDVDTGVDWYTRAEAIIELGGTVDALAEPADTGPIDAAAGKLTEIVTPVAGWNTATNAAAATSGRNRETNDELRIRRRQSLQIVGAASAEAIRSRLRQLTGVDAAVVVDNDSHESVVIGGKTLLPYSMAAAVYPAATDAVKETVAAVLWLATAGATYLVGDLAYNVTDVEDVTQVVRFSLASTILVEVTVDLVVDASGGPTEAQVEAYVLAYFDALSVGDQPRGLPIYNDIHDNLQGVIDATVSFAALGGGALVVGMFEVPTTDAARITVNYV